MCDVGYKCGSQGHNRNQVKCEADNSIKTVKSPASSSNTTVNTDQDGSIVGDGVFSPGKILVRAGPCYPHKVPAPPHVLVDPEDSARVVERAVPVPVTGLGVHLDLAPLADHRDGGPVGADRHLPAYIEPALLTALTAVVSI